MLHAPHNFGNRTPQHRWTRTRQQHVFKPRAAQQQTITGAQAGSAVGMLGLPGVVTPRDLVRYWEQQSRPKLEILLRRTSIAPARPALLPLVDELLWELRQISAPARHLAACHADGEWRAAGEQVARDAAKVEAYLFRSRGLYSKLQDVRAKLAASLASNDASTSSSTAASTARGDSAATSASLAALASGNSTTPPPGGGHAPASAPASSGRGSVNSATSAVHPPASTASVTLSHTSTAPTVTPAPSTAATAPPAERSKRMQTRYHLPAASTIPGVPLLEDGCGRSATTPQLLRLADLLIAAFERKGVNVSDGLSHLLASYAAPVYEDPTWQRSKSAAEVERQLAGQIREAVLRPPVQAPLLQLATDIDWSKEDWIAPAGGPTNGHSESQVVSAGQGRAPAAEPSNGSADRGATPDGGSDTDCGTDVLPPWAHDDLLCSLVARTRRVLDPGSGDGGHTNDRSHGRDQIAGRLRGRSHGTAGTTSDLEEDSDLGSNRISSDPEARSEKGGTRSHFQHGASWGDVILLDSYSTQLLLRRHPKRHVRQAVWEQGVLTRGRQVMALRTRMAHARSTMAEAAGAPSYAVLLQEFPLGHTSPSPGHTSPAPGHTFQEQSHTSSHRKSDAPSAHLARLQAMAVDIRAAADAEVQEMVAALNHSLGCHDDTAAHSGIENGGTVHGDVGSSSSSNVSTADKATATLHGKGAVSTSGNSSSVAGRSRSTAVHQQYTSNTGVAQQYRLEPWDVEYCQQYLQAGTLQYSEVQQYLTLAGVLQGLSSVTDSLFGVRLRVVHIPSNFQPPALKKQGGAAGLPDLDLPPKVWSPDVVTLLVEVESAGHTEGHMQGHTRGSQGGVSPSGYASPAVQVNNRSTPQPIRAEKQYTPAGVLYLDVGGGGYCTRLLRTARLWGQPVQEQPAVRTARMWGQCSPSSTTYDNGNAQPTGNLDLAPHHMAQQGRIAQEQDHHSSLDGGEAGAARRSWQEGWSEMPHIAIGLDQPWRDGHAGTFQALWVLTHELGHALHLALSSHRASFGAESGLQLPLEALEVPSMLFEHLLMHPATLASICRLPAQPLCEQDPASTAALPLSATESSLSATLPGSAAQPSHITTLQSSAAESPPTTTLPQSAAVQLSRQFRQQHYSPLAVQERVLVALGDQALNMTPVGSHASAAAAFTAVWDKHSSLEGVPITLKRLASLSIASHHQASYHAYLYAHQAASYLWTNLLEPIVEQEWAEAVGGSAKKQGQPTGGVLYGASAATDKVQEWAERKQKQKQAVGEALDPLEVSVKADCQTGTAGRAEQALEQDQPKAASQRDHSTSLVPGSGPGPVTAADRMPATPCKPRKAERRRVALEAGAGWEGYEAWAGVMHQAIQVQAAHT